MFCDFCREVKESSEKRPFVSRDIRIIGDRAIYQCIYCKQRWFRHDNENQLWAEINDDLAWKVLKDMPMEYFNGYVNPVETCAIKVVYPKLCISLDGKKREKTVALQWFGEYKKSVIFNHQFLFPIMLSPDEFGGDF